MLLPANDEDQERRIAEARRLIGRVDFPVFGLDMDLMTAPSFAGFSRVRDGQPLALAFSYQLDVDARVIVETSRPIQEVGGRPLRALAEAIWANPHATLGELLSEYKQDWPEWDRLRVSGPTPRPVQVDGSTSSMSVVSSPDEWVGRIPQASVHITIEARGVSDEKLAVTQLARWHQWVRPVD